jgi:release factor glutamine methyltransferase
VNFGGVTNIKTTRDESCATQFRMSHEPQITTRESPPDSSPHGPVTDIRSALRDAIVQLEREGVPSAALAAELLLLYTLEKDRAWMYGHPEHELDAVGREKYFSMIARRASGVPTQHLTGRQEFWGLDFEVTPDVLIPRPETEHVIEVALERLGISSGNDSSRRAVEFRIADVGTGSGCIAVALAHELPGARIVATDISSPALEVARRNAGRHEVASRIDFVECNLLDIPLQELSVKNSGEGSFHLIVSNPPYIGRREAPSLSREVRDHEPEAALFGGEIGTELYAPLIDQAVIGLKPGGIVVLELGYNSAEHVTRLLGTAEWTNIVVTNDLAGIARVVSARRALR